VATTQGRPLSPADEYRIVDDDGRDVLTDEVGELLARGPCTLRGYYRAEEYNAHTFTPDGFLRTGDLARITKEGNLVVEGRIKDVVNRGGEKVGAAELEEQIEAHPRVRSAAVVAAPDAALGEKICAFLVTHEPVGLGELRAFLTGRGLAAFKLPDRVEHLPELPRTEIGKVDKKELRRRLAEGAG
jgi:2,3-dihydroxybenzoate-AMP ligase